MQKFRILFVCTGNTCRSPMAEGIARHLVAEGRLGAIDPSTVRIESAGTGCMPGAPPSEEAIDVLSDQGIDISGHRSQAVNRDLIEESTVVYCMTQRHLDAVRAMAPDAASRVKLLDPAGNDVDDPIGLDREFYEHTAGQIRALLEARFAELAES